jgi:enoyl-CoA hydratase
MPEVTLTREGPVAVLTLDDGKANAFRPSNLPSIHAALREVAASEAGALLLRGRPGFFCGGFDLKVVPLLPEGERTALLLEFVDTMMLAATFPKPVVAALAGHAFGGGALLALAADVRVGGAGSWKFATNEVAIGIAMPSLGIEICRTHLAGSVLHETVALARVWTAQETFDRGIVHGPHADVDSAALARAELLARLPGAAYAETFRRMTQARFERARQDGLAELAAFTRAFSGG